MSAMVCRAGLESFLNKRRLKIGSLAMRVGWLEHAEMLLLTCFRLLEVTDADAPHSL